MILVLDMEWRESKPPPMSIEDRTVVGPADLQGKPRSITLNLSIQYYYLSIVHLRC